MADTSLRLPLCDNDDDDATDEADGRLDTGALLLSDDDLCCSLRHMMHMYMITMRVS